MKLLKQRYAATITLLSPLHIGSGRELLRDYDYVTHGGKTWVIDAAAMLDHFVGPQGELDSRIIGRPAAELLKDQDFVEGSPSFRYVLPGQPRAQGAGAVLREQYKDGRDQPYIPGSSLKGSLRTILLWHGFRSAKLSLDVNALSDSRSWTAQPIERRLFGSDPNHDLLRGLLVADSQPQPASKLRIANAQVVTGSEKMGSPVEVEAVWTDTAFETTWTIDSYLNSEGVRQKLGLGGEWSWLAGLPEIARAWGAEYLRKERDWFHQRKYSHVAGLYHQMLGILTGNKLAPNQFFINLGWGGGWSAKTVGAPLQADAKEWERLLNDKRRSPARFRRREGDAFPKSRRVLVQGGQVVAPFGWCLVELKEIPGTAGDIKK
jgi:CRISPR-associated protein Csm5